MIAHEPVSAILRIGDGDPADPYREFTAVCTLVYESASVAWVKALMGQLTRSQLRELLDWCNTQGLVTLKAMRAPGHQLPGFKAVGAHLELDVQALLQRVSRDGQAAVRALDEHQVVA